MKFKFPTAHSVLIIIAALVAGLTYLVPAGSYDRLAYDSEAEIFKYQGSESSRELPATQETLDELGIGIPINKFEDGLIWKPVGVPGTYHQLESKPQGIVAFILSPIKGISQAIDVILFVLIIGGFIGVVNYTGAFDAGIARLATALKGREQWLIILITTLIAAGGTTFGLAEETIAFYPILVPVFLAARYDAMVALACIYIGSSMGTMASTVNPFSAIIASDAAGITWTDGLAGRLFVWAIGLAVCIGYIMRYAARVKKDPTRSIIYAQKEEIEQHFAIDKSKQNLPFDWRISLILVTFGLCFGVMIFGVSRLEWWFEEMTAVFLVGSVVIGLIAWIKERRFVSEFIKGANDLLSVALIIGIARGITVLMEDGQISDTLLYYAGETVSGMGKGLFVNVMLYLYAGLSFFIPSSSGMAVLTMPIMAPLADVVEVSRVHVVNAYQYGMGLMAFITPTGLILASLTMVNVTYDKWLKFVMPLLVLLTVLTMIYLTIAVYVS